jgi:16S rRNA (guanine527-N7)-methyltransferase
MDISQFQEALEKRGISLSSLQLQQFNIYYDTLVEWNAKMNLTGITELSEVYHKHFYDSLTASFYFDFTDSLSVCDVGAGAGFPSVPLKICFPHLEITIVDSLQKRIGFLKHLASELGLNRVSFYHDRAETFAKQSSHREQYDLVLARAVARMAVLSELCLPLVKIGGTFLAMKGVQLPEELEESQKAISILGGAIERIERFSLPFDGSGRQIVRIKKASATPSKYPRKPGTPNRAPLH